MALDDARRKMIAAYVDGELSVDKTLEVDQWARDFTEVREEIARQKLMTAKIQEACDAPLPAGFEDRLRQTMQATAAQPAGAARGPVSEARSGSSWAWGAAAAILVFALLLPIVLEGPQQGTDFLARAEFFHEDYIKLGEPENKTNNLESATRKLNTQFVTNYTPSAMAVAHHDSGPDAKFEGWCNLRVEGAPNARRFAYTIDGVPASLYLVNSSIDLPCDLLHKEIRSNERLYMTGNCAKFNVVKWQQGAVHYVLISSLPVSTLVKVMDGISFARSNSQ